MVSEDERRRLRLSALLTCRLSPCLADSEDIGSQEEEEEGGFERDSAEEGRGRLRFHIIASFKLVVPAS